MPTRRRIALVALAAITTLAVVTACRDVVAPTAAPTAPTVTGPAPSASLIGSLLRPTGLLNCRPLPFDSVTRVIGRGGGTIHVGPHTFRVPPGALDHPVAITAVVRPLTVNQVTFAPHGLHFNRPAWLTMSYANCSIVGWLLPQHIAYTDDQLHILELLPALDNLFTRTVTSRIGHFSGYVIAF